MRVPISDEVNRPQNETDNAGQGPLERAFARENLKRAWKRVKANKGAAGVDGLDIEQTAKHLLSRWPTICEQLISGAYRPSPVKRVVIPKPDGGERELGIPTVTDRLIQQALLQVLQSVLDPTFSEHSYGFRPGRCAQDAVLAAQRHVSSGRRVVVDVDLEKFFDRVDHDILIDRLRRRIADPAVIRLILSYLDAGALISGTLPNQHAKLPSKKTHISHTFQAWENIACAKRRGYCSGVAANSAIGLGNPDLSRRTAPRERLFYVRVMAGCAQEASACRFLFTGLPTCVQFATPSLGNEMWRAPLLNRSISMTKKITPDPPFARKVLSTADRATYLRKPSDTPSNESEPVPANTPRLLDTLAFTSSKPVIPEAPYKPTLFAIQPGITAQDALIYVSNLLETAELNGDEISLHTNPVERALFWGMLHSVEVARAVVDALLEGKSPSNQLSSASGNPPNG